MRVLKLDGTTPLDVRRFELLWHSFCLWQPEPGMQRAARPRSREELERDADLQELLEGASVEDETIADNPRGVPPRRLKPGAVTISLRESELQLLLAQIPTIGWLRMHSRDVRDLLKFLSNAETSEG